jgi:hypothetical protein
MSFAPASLSAFAASTRVEPVLTMSSKITTFFPSTSPITFIISTASGRGRRLSTIARLAERRFAYARAIFTLPMSGATTTTFGICRRR